MSCTFNRELLALYVHDDATAAERSEAEAHLAGCAECQSIWAQYRELGLAVAGKEARLSLVRPGRRRWRVALGIAASVLLLLGVVRVPVVAAQMARLFPFLTVTELNREGVAEFLRRINASRDEGPSVLYRPLYFTTWTEAEEAWGGPLPQPQWLPAGMELYRISFADRPSGSREVGFYYSNRGAGKNVNIRFGNQQPQRSLPEGATSEAMVNGQKAAVTRGTFGQYEGEPVKWEPETDIHLYFQIGDLYADVFTAGQGATLEELVQMAESIR